MMPEDYSKASLAVKDSPPLDALSKFGIEARRLFGKEGSAVFYQLGYGVKSERSLSSVRLAVTDALRGYASVSAAQLPECQCNTIDECPFGGDCDGAANCSETWGCGPGGQYRCHNLCFDPSNGAASGYASGSR